MNQLVLRLFFYLLPPLAAFPLLLPEGPLAWFLLPGLVAALWVIYPARILVLEKNRLRLASWSDLLGTAGALAVWVYVLFLVIYAVSIPPEIYERWFLDPEFRRSSPPSLVIWGMTWASSMVAIPLARRRGIWLPLALFVASWCLLMAAIWGESAAGVVVVLGIAFAALILLRKRLGKRSLLLRSIVLLICAVVVVVPSPGPARTRTIDQELLELVRDIAGDIPLILDIPGNGIRQIRDDFGTAENLSPRAIMSLEGLDPGRYYVEVRRSAALSNGGWSFPAPRSVETTISGRPLSFPPAIVLTHEETWWQPSPAQIRTGNRLVLRAAVSSPPVDQGTRVGYFPDNIEAFSTRSEQNALLTPPRIYNWAQEVRGLEFEEQVRFLRDTLWDEFRYSLSTTPVSGSEHPLTKFLDEGRGYCLHFATAGAVFFAELGYEVRFVEGYAGLSENGQAQVRGLDSHAWVLVERPGLGVTLVDPTPPIRFSSVLDASLDPYTLRYLEYLMAAGSTGRTQIELSTVLPTTEATETDYSWWPLAAGAGVLLLAAAWAWFLRPVARWRRQMVGRRPEPMSLEAAEDYYGRASARELYLPSLLEWNGYRQDLGYLALRKQLRRLSRQRAGQRVNLPER